MTASHPHFYGCAAFWQAAFDATALGVVTSFSTWRGSVELLPGVTLIQCGGHFPGSAVVLVASGDGVLLSGDTVMVTPGADRATFIWSAPNQLPLSGRRRARYLGVGGAA